MRAFLLFVFVPLVLWAQDAREIVRRSCELDQREVEISRNYTFLQRQVESDLDSAGRPKNKETRTFDVTLQEGSPYRRLVARDDHPLSPQEQHFEDEKLQRNIELRRKETPAQRDRRVADWERKRQKQREPLKELPDAFDFKLVREEVIDGQDVYVIDATPRPGYKPKSTSTSFFPKVKARLWIAKSDYHWAKVEMDVMDTISFGGFLLRVAKGGHLMIEQARINREVWLPKRVTLEASARLVLVKGYHKSLDITFSDYKKFQTDSRVVATEEKP